MTFDRLRKLAGLAMADVPHMDIHGTLACLQFMEREEREQAALVYAALIGERLLPARIGRIERRAAR